MSRRARKSLGWRNLLARPSFKTLRQARPGRSTEQESWGARAKQTVPMTADSARREESEG